MEKESNKEASEYKMAEEEKFPRETEFRLGDMSFGLILRKRGAYISPSLLALQIPVEGLVDQGRNTAGIPSPPGPGRRIYQKKLANASPA